MGRKTHVMARIGVVLIATACACQTVLADKTIAEQQKEQVQKLLVEMNQSSKELADTIISEPQKAIDAGCLDSIHGIDLSVFTIDFTNIWGALYNSIKDKILNQACDAANTWANSQMAKLNTTLEAPLGLGKITIGQGTAIKDWQSAVTKDVKMDNTELATQVTTDTLGQVPPPGLVSKAVKKAEASQDTPGHNKEDWEAKIKDMLDIKQLWNEGDDEAEKTEE